MGDIYKARWERAKELAEELDTKIRSHPGCVVYREEVWEDPQVVITPCCIYIKTKIANHVLFENNKDFDHGLHNTIEETEEMFKEIKVLVPV